MMAHSVTFYDPITRHAFGPFTVANQREFARRLGDVAFRLYAMPREIGWQFEGSEPDFVAGYRNTRFDLGEAL